MTIAAWMQPLQYNLQSSAAKDNNITHAAAAASNLDAATPMRSATGDSKTPYNYAHTTTPKAACSHRYNAAKKKRQTDRSRNRRTHEVPFIVACSHFTRKNTRFRAPASSPKHSPCNIMQPFQWDLQPQIPKHPITTHTQPHPKQLQTTVTLRQKKTDKPTAAATVAHTRYLSSSPAATLHGKTQGFVLRLPPQNIAHATFMQPFQCDLQPQLQETHRTTHTGTTTVAKHIEGTKRPQPQPPHTRGTFHRRLQPLYTEKHKVSCSGFPSLLHHFPSSPLPFIITSLFHHFPSSPLPLSTTSLRHHFPSSPLPFVTTSLRHHFPSSPLPFLTTSLRHHFPSSPLPFVTTSLRHHPSLSPPFIKVNSTASYSFVMYCYVMYCYVMYCYVIYHPASFQVAEFHLSVTRKYCFSTSFDNLTNNQQKVG